MRVYSEIKWQRRGKGLLCLCAMLKIAVLSAGARILLG